MHERTHKGLNLQKISCHSIYRSKGRLYPEDGDELLKDAKHGNVIRFTFQEGIEDGYE